MRASYRGTAGDAYQHADIHVEPNLRAAPTGRAAADPRGSGEAAMHAVPLESVIFSLPHELIQRLDQARGQMSRADAVGMIIHALLRGSVRLMPVDANGTASPSSGNASHAAEDADLHMPPTRRSAGAGLAPAWPTAGEDEPDGRTASLRHKMARAVRRVRQWLTSPRGTMAVVGALCVGLAISVVSHTLVAHELNRRTQTVNDLQIELAEAKAGADKLLVTLNAVERDRDILRGRIALKDGSTASPARATQPQPQATTTAAAGKLPKPPRARPAAR